MPPKVSQNGSQLEKQGQNLPRNVAKSEIAKQTQSQSVDNESQSENRENSPKKTKLNKNDTKFNKSWTSKSKRNTHYGVIKKGSDDYHIFCACSPNTEIKSSSWRHHQTTKTAHLKWLDSNPPEDIEFFEEDKIMSRDDQIFQYRCKIGLLCAQNNLSFQVTQDIVQFFEDKDLVKQILLDSLTNRQNIKEIICDCLAPCIENRLKQILEDKCFVFFVDGWSDRIQCHFSICLRYWDHNKGIQNRFFDDQSYSLQGTGDKEFSLIDESLLQKYGNKALQFVADGAMGTMVKNQELVNSGKSKSVAGFLKNKYKHIEIQHCLDHVIDIINHKAFKLVPKEISNLIQAIPSKIRTAQAKDYLKDIFYKITLQDWVEREQQQGNFFISEQIEAVQFRQIPQFCSTRWYGNFTLILRIIQNYDVLKVYFATEKYKDQKILETLNKPETRLYLDLLRLFLQKTLHYIELFQQDNITLAESQKCIDLFVQEFSQYFLVKQDMNIDDRYNIDYSQFDKNSLIFNSKDFVFSQILLRHRKELNLNYQEGSLYYNSMLIANQQHIIDFIIDYIKAILMGISKYYGTSKQRIKSLQIIYPTQIIDQNDAQYWLNKYDNIIISRDLEQNIYSNIDVWNYNHDRIKNIFNIKHSKNINNFYLDEELNKEFPYLMHFLQQLLLLIIPSSAFNERVHSILKIIRNYHRQTLLLRTVRQLLMAKYNQDLIDLKDQETIQELQKHLDDLKKKQAAQNNFSRNLKEVRENDSNSGEEQVSKGIKKKKTLVKQLTLGKTPLCVKIAEYKPQEIYRNDEDDDGENNIQYSQFDNQQVDAQSQENQAENNTQTDQEWNK